MIARENRKPALKCSCCQKPMTKPAYSAYADAWCSAECVNYERKHGRQDPRTHYCRLRPVRLYIWEKPGKSVRIKFAKTSKIAAGKADEVCIKTLLNSDSITEACKTIGISETRMRTRVFRWLSRNTPETFVDCSTKTGGKSLKKVFEHRRDLQKALQW